MRFTVDEGPPIPRSRALRGIVVGVLAATLLGGLSRVLISRLPDWAWFLPGLLFLLLVAAWSAIILITRRKAKSRA